MNGEFWVKYELAEPKSVDMIDLAARFGAESDRMPTWFRIEGSNDGENYDELLNSGTLTWTHNETKTWDLNYVTPYKFYKIEAVNTKSAYITIAEIQLIEHITTREY